MIKVERNDPPIVLLDDLPRPIAIWWTNHEWSDLTIEEARQLYEDLRDAVEHDGDPEEQVRILAWETKQ